MSTTYCKMPLDQIASPQHLFTQFYFMDLNSISFFLEIQCSLILDWLFSACIFDTYPASDPAASLTAALLPFIWLTGCSGCDTTHTWASPICLPHSCRVSGTQGFRFPLLIHHLLCSFLTRSFSYPAPGTITWAWLLMKMMFLGNTECSSMVATMKSELVA